MSTNKTPRVIGYSPWGHISGNITPFESVFTHKKDITQGIEGIDCLLLWGGTDIHPSYYKQSHSRQSYAPAEPTERDRVEWKAMLYCKAHDIPIIGVCRGAQYLCAFAGGSLVQHVEKHGYDHLIATSDGRSVWTTSSHHQMMNPYSVPHDLLAWTFNPQNKVYHGEDDKQIAVMESNHEPEIVFFPEVRGLAIQGHPEYGTATQPFRDLCVEYVKTYLFGESK